MNGLIAQVFSWVCSQNAAHTWAPGGELLPMCQRCTGFYVGAAIAFVLMLRFRPQINARYRWLHVALVLAMTPFGFHLAPQGAIVRTLSGQWFGFGVVGLLWLLPEREFSDGRGRSGADNGLHLILGLFSFVLVPAFACWGGFLAARFLPWLALSGLAALAGLLTMDVVILLSWFFGSWRTRAEH